MKKFYIVYIIYFVVLLGLPFLANAIKIDNPIQYDKIEDILAAITELLKNIAILVGTIMIIISGIQYITSAGNEEKITKAKKNLVYTIIGVAIIFAADLIIDFIREILNKT